MARRRETEELSAFLIPWSTAFGSGGDLVGGTDLYVTSRGGTLDQLGELQQAGHDPRAEPVRRHERDGEFCLRSQSRALENRAHGCRGERDHVLRRRATREGGERG